MLRRKHFNNFRVILNLFKTLVKGKRTETLNKQKKNFSKENKEAQLKFSVSVCECLRARPLK